LNHYFYTFLYIAFPFSISRNLTAFISLHSQFKYLFTVISITVSPILIFISSR